MANNEEPVQKQVLDAARRLTNNGKEPFTIAQIVAALPELNKGTVRTHVSSRCCVNAPCNHLHRWPYFYRLSRGLYRLRRPFILARLQSAGKTRPAVTRGPETEDVAPTGATRPTVALALDQVPLPEARHLP